MKASREVNASRVALTCNGIQTLRVAHAYCEAQDVVALTLVDPEGRQLPAWTAGAHVDVVLPSGLVRQYSLCGDPADRDSYTIAVLRDTAGRGGSVEITDPALVGRDIGVSQPRNHFPLMEAEHYVFVAGGIGITPMLSLARAAQARGATWQLAYAGRRRASMAFLAEVTALSSYDHRVDTFVTEEKSRLDVDELVMNAPTGAAVYCCGPERLITAVESACANFLSPSAFHTEHFAAPARSPMERREPGASFDVELRRAGVVLHVSPEQSMLEVVRDAVPGVLSSCESGFCGACVATVLEGVPEHHDTVLTDAERKSNDTVILCVGRAKSDRLVLDL
jgi:ferredoxin-NADP reductase